MLSSASDTKRPCWQIPQACIVGVMKSAAMIGIIFPDSTWLLCLLVGYGNLA